MNYADHICAICTQIYEETERVAGLQSDSAWTAAARWQNSKLFNREAREATDAELSEYRRRGSVEVYS